MHLYEINTSLYRLFLDISDKAELPDSIYDQINELELQKSEKIINLGLLHKSFEAEAEAIRAEEKKLAARRQAIENRAERIKSYIRMNLDENESYYDPRIVVKTQNTYKAVIDQKQCPAEYFTEVQKIERKADTDRIKLDLLSGKEIPGCYLEKTVVIK